METNTERIIRGEPAKFLKLVFRGYMLKYELTAKQAIKAIQRELKVLTYSDTTQIREG